jgi:AAA domain/DnaB-like helicase N terminal domain
MQLPMLPPVALEAERAVLGTFIVEPQYVPVYRARLRPEAFWKDSHRLLWHTLLRMDAAGQPIDTLTVRAVLEDSAVSPVTAADLALLIAEAFELAPGPGLLDAYVGRVEEMARRRAVLFHAHELYDRIAAGQPAETSLAQFHDALARERIDPAATAAAPAYVQSAADFLGESEQTPPWIFPGLLPQGVLMLLHGEPRARKSLVALELALAAHSGTAPFGIGPWIPAGPLSVLYVQEEDPRDLTRLRLRRLLAERGGAADPSTLWMAVRVGLSLDDPEWIRRLLHELHARQIRLLVLDAARRLSAHTDEGPTQVRTVMGVLRRLIAETGVSIVIVHHDIKPPVQGPDLRRRGQRASGGDWFAGAECPVHVERLTTRESLFFPEDFKFGPDPPAVSIELVLDGPYVAQLRGTLLGEGQAEQAGVRGRLLDWLRRHGPASRTQLRQAGFRWDTSGPLLEELMREQLVDAAPGRNNGTFRYFAVGYEPYQGFP